MTELYATYEAVLHKADISPNRCMYDIITMLTSLHLNWRHGAANNQQQSSILTL